MHFHLRVGSRGDSVPVFLSLFLVISFYETLKPISLLLLTGKEKNFVYSHLHPTGRGYQPHPKPAGVAFGGTPGNERIFIDDDFSKLTVRHHAVDKTYQSGSLIPDQV